MFKRTFTLVAVVFALALGVTLQSPPVCAQDQTNFTYVSEWAVPRSQWAAFEKERDQSNSVMQRLVADGTLIAWGADNAYVHTEDGYTHEDWFVSNSRAGILKALEAARSTATGPAFSAVTKHKDYFLRTLAHGGKTSSGATGYLRVASYQTKPGEGTAFVDHFKKYIQPRLDGEVADGTILMYNFDVEEIHTDTPGAYDLAIVYPSGEAMDKAYTRLDAASKENPAVGQVIASVTLGEAHRDSFAKVAFYQHK
ncbi:MAG: hypothetical protein WBC04_07190 [Candidatus Acidiferrales bacterium]